MSEFLGYLGYREDGFKPYLVITKQVVVEKFAVWASDSINAVVPFIGADEIILSVEELPMRGLRTRLIRERKGFTRDTGYVDEFCEGSISFVRLQ